MTETRERTDVSLQFLVTLAATAIVVGAAAYGGSLLAVRLSRPARPDAVKARSPRIEPDALPPRPRLQPSPPAELELHRARQRELLATYGWMDPERKVVRVPIERAMELVAERGLPEWGSRPAR